MNKFTFAALSLIAAIPGGYLSYLLVMAMLGNFSSMVTMMRVIVCGILACSVVATVIPIGILIFVQDEKEAGEEEAEEAEAAEEIEDIEAVESADEEAEVPEDETMAYASDDDIEVTDTDQVSAVDIPDADADEEDLEKSVEFEPDFGGQDIYVTEDAEVDVEEEDERLGTAGEDDLEQSVVIEPEDSFDDFDLTDEEDEEPEEKPEKK